MCKLNRPRNECLWALRAVLAGGVGRIPSVACRARGPVAGKAGPRSGAPGAFHLPVHQHPPHLLTVPLSSTGGRLEPLARDLEVDLKGKVSQNKSHEGS